MSASSASLLTSDPFSIELMSNPLPFYKALRDNAPVKYYEEYDTFFFSRFDDVWEVLRVGDNAFVATETNLPTPEYLRTHRNDGAPPFASTSPMAAGPSLPSPYYEEMRLAHIAPLRPKSVAALQQFVLDLVRSRLDELLPRGRFDLIRDYAGFTAATVICHLFGIPLDRAPAILRCVGEIAKFDPLKGGVDLRSFFVELKEHIVPAVAARRAVGADGSNALIDGLVNYRNRPDGRALSDNEIADQLVCVMVGGMESAPKVTAAGILELWKRPEQLAAVRADLDTNVPIAAEEIIRYCAPAQYTFRTAHKDVVVAGQQVKAGQRVACLLHSASRDEREFADPEAFVWNRPIDRVLSFGLGQHHCIGKHLAKLEVVTLIREFLSRVDRFEMLEAEAVRNPSCFQRGWISLPVRIATNGRYARRETASPRSHYDDTGGTDAMTRYYRLMLATGACATFLTSVPAQAQEGAQNQILGEVTVTARKREESILRVPVVTTAISAAALEEYQTNNLYAVANRVPGFVMGESVGTVGIQTSLRGIGPTSQTATVDQSVSLNIDGLALTQGYAYTAGMFDVAQVEVLKGPQSLFYGKNSTAGVISLRSADPTSEFELIGRAAYETEAAERVGEAIVSGPVGESLKLRLAARYSDMDGFFRNNGEPVAGRGNVAPKHRDFAPRETTILRGTALFEPNDIYKARLKLNFVDDRMEGNGGDGQLILCPDGTGGVPPLNFPFIDDADCKLDKYTQLADFDPASWPGVRNGGVPFLDAQQIFGTLDQDIAFTPRLTLTSVTGLYDIKQDNLIRGSGSSNPTIAADFTFENEQFTQELRLTSDYDSALNFMIGAFYQDAKMTVVNRLRGNSAFGLPALLQAGVHEVDIESVSAFGQLIWKVTDQVEIAGGARWTDEERTHSLFNTLTNSEVDLLVPKISADNVSPEFSVTYTPTPDLTLFGAYRQGFKSGSFNTIAVVNSTTPADFGDEEAKGGEIGLKTRLFDRRMVLNLALYRYDYEDLQVGANDLSDTGAILLRTINAASAKVEGVDFDVTYSPSALPDLTLYAAANYNRARFEEFNNAPCGNGQTIAQGCDQLINPATGRYTSQDLAGRPLVRAPDWSGSVGFDYSTPIGQDLLLSFGATAQYSDEFYTNLVELPDYKQDDYIKTSASISLKGRDDAWEVALIGNNLSNEITAGLCSNSNTQNGTVFGGQIAGGPVQGAAGSDELGCVAERGREVWLRVMFKPSALLGGR